MEQDLVARAQQGDQRAFESLTAANHARLFRVAQGILRDSHLAEDATQQAFLDIWRHIPRLAAGGFLVDRVVMRPEVLGEVDASLDSAPGPNEPTGA